MVEKNPIILYAYYTADCRTPNCVTAGKQNSRVIKFRGVQIDGVPELPEIRPKEIIVTCPKCSKSYNYEAAELVPVYLPEREIGFKDLF